MWVQTPWRGYLRSKISFFMYNTIFVYILRVPVSMKGSKGHQKSRKQRKQTGFKELAHICVLCSAIASPSLLSSSPIRVNPTSWPTSNQLGMQRAQRERHSSGRRHQGAPCRPKKIPTYKKQHHNSTVTQPTNQHQRTTPNPPALQESESSTESGGIDTRTATDIRSTCFLQSSYAY